MERACVHTKKASPEWRRKKEKSIVLRGFLSMKNVFSSALELFLCSKLFLPSQASSEKCISCTYGFCCWQLSFNKRIQYVGLVFLILSLFISLTAIPPSPADNVALCGVNTKKKSIFTIIPNSFPFHPSFQINLFSLFSPPRVLS